MYNGMGMNEQVLKNRWGGRNRILISCLIIIFSIVIIILFFSVNSSGKIVYVTTNGSGDFNCNGSNDQVEINKALAYVAENPQFTAVYLNGPNTYTISNSIFIGSNTILEGDSSAVIKLKVNADWNVDKPLITQMDNSGDHDITIKGFEISGNHDKNSDKSNGQGYYNLMYFTNSENIQVNDMYMHDSHGDGLKISRGSNIQFYNNTVYKMGHDALYAIYCSNLEAWNNNITCRTNSGLRIYNTNHVKFANNIINSEGEGGAGIEVQKDDPPTIMDDIEICNNLLDETNAAGIWITGYGSYYSKDSAKDIHIHSNSRFN
jgi:hypothetical protein